MHTYYAVNLGVMLKIIMCLILFQNCSCTSYSMYDLLADYVAGKHALHRDFEWSAV